MSLWYDHDGLRLSGLDRRIFQRRCRCLWTPGLFKWNYSLALFLRFGRQALEPGARMDTPDSILP